MTVRPSAHTLRTFNNNSTQVLFRVHPAFHGIDMRASYTVLILLVLWSVCQSQRTALDDHLGLYRVVRELLFNVIGKTSATGGWQLKAATDQRRLQKLISPDTPFPCDVTNARSPRPPTSVHRLRPGDIDIIASMGDSLTAGFGAVATSLPHILIENRGVSWSGGGQKTWREFLTIPNIIKVFNPKLFGFALGDGFTTHKISQFNVAEGGAESRDLPYMADTLVKRMKNDPRVDLKRHWKMINVMIGSNDFCTEICYERSPWAILDMHRNDLLRTFRILRDNLPRTIISLVISPHLQTMVEFTGRSPACNLIVDAECTCLFGLRWRHLRKEYYSIMSEWQKIEEEFALMPEFQTEDFTIVPQYFVSNVTFPTTAYGLTDFTYLSTDCFHLSQKAYARAANAFWNNLLEPFGKKSTAWEEPLKRFLCPTSERPYITTFKNNQ